MAGALGDVHWRKTTGLESQALWRGAVSVLGAGGEDEFPSTALLRCEMCPARGQAALCEGQLPGM